MIKYALPFTLLPLLASCAAPRVSPPVVAPVTPHSTPAPVAVVDRYAGDWSVDELTPGEWRYSHGSGTARATFTDNSGAVMVVIACGNNGISLGRSGSVPADSAVSMRVRNSFALRELPARADQATRLIYTSLDARDPLWDQIAYSNGRFLIETSAQPPLIAPTSAAISRVIEDCRS